ncbi:hypothetical protein Plhal304r1_c009g0035371 [Plasmopara halstedii]
MLRGREGEKAPMSSAFVNGTVSTRNQAIDGVYYLASALKTLCMRQGIRKIMDFARGLRTK